MAEQNGTALTPEEHDQQLAMTAAGSDRWEQQATTYCRLMYVRELVRTGRISESEVKR